MGKWSVRVQKFMFLGRDKSLLSFGPAEAVLSLQINTGLLKLLKLGP